MFSRDIHKTCGYILLEFSTINCIHTPIKAHVYTENSSRGLFHGTPLENITLLSNQYVHAAFKIVKLIIYITKV